MDEKETGFMTGPIGKKQWLFFTLFVLVIGSFAAYSNFFENAPAKPKVSKTASIDYESPGNIQLAWEVNKKFINQNLKAPSTAEFPSFWNAQDHVSYLGHKRYKIQSWVDAQNTFGAKIRENYVSIVKMGQSKNQWTLEMIKFQ